ncbi:TPA: NAD-dependent ubiquitin ligase, partial [Legionella pneumophila]|nr:NAD-dependent ubiquitin ligase [Legionella pneumophila]
PGPLKNPKAPEEGRLPPNEGPDRGPHGLAHTVRTMACAEVMIEEARKAQLRGETLGIAKNGQTLADVTPEELKKILIAQAFFVVGRDDERSGYDESRTRNFYAEYHEQSELAFRKYVEDNKLIGKVFKDQKEVDFYAAIILDKNHEWDTTPAHILINQGHMVDLMRVKTPSEVTLEIAYNELKNTVGSKGAEVVLKAHRDFFFVTGAVVPLVNPEAIDDPSRGGPYENPYSGEKFVIVDDKVPASKKDLPKAVNRDYKLKDNERFLTIKEYYAFPDVQQTYPGYKTRLEGSSYYFPTPFARECERDPAKCRGAIQKARSKLQTDAIKNGFQSSSDKARRQPNVDEIAAARIIQQIMANPDCIHDDHVSINGQELGEKFFRDLLAKCDMAVVGSLLNDTDIKNIDTLIQHEKDTEFHSTGSDAVPVKIGSRWFGDIRQGETIDDIKVSLISLMQNDAWYFSRVNAIAQNRDEGSNFKEVLFTALMTPLTNKSLMDTSHAPAPKKLYRGLNLPQEFTNKLINQSNAIIANTENTLFTDLSAEAFKQIKLNDLSKMSGRTNASTTTNIELCRIIWDSNVIFEMLDPDGLLQPKQVGRHGEGTENEFSVYLPEDVALVPVKVTHDESKTQNGGNRYIFTFVAVKSPDFIPRHESGYAVEPFLRMQTAKLAEIKSSVENNLVVPIIELQSELSLVEETALSPAYKNFIKNTVGPVLENFLNGFMERDAVALSKALAAFPPDGQWSAFNSEVAEHAKRQMDALKQMVPNIVVLNTLAQCQDALEKQNIAGALEAFKNIPSEKEMGTISRELREQIQSTRQELESLQRAVVTPVITDEKKVRERYDALIEGTSKKVTELEKATLDKLDVIKKAISNLGNLRQEVTLLHNEKVRMHSKTDTIDFSDIEKLEQQIQVMDTKLADAYLLAVTKQISALESIPKDQSELKAKIATFFDTITEIEMLYNERIKKHNSSTDPLDLSDLKGRIQRVNQSLVSNLIKTIRASIIQMKSNTFKMQEKEIEENMELLEKLEKSMDKSKASEKLREDIPKLKDLLVAQQKAYPKMTQLIDQLRELCQSHHDDLNKKRTARLQELERQTREGGITGIVGNLLFGVTNMIGLTKDEQLEIKMKQQSLARFKADLFDEKNDIDALLVKLAYKSPSDLQEGLGISENNAKELDSLIRNLVAKTYSANELEEKLKAIDEISPKLARECGSLKFEAIDNDESTGNTMRF